MVDIDPELKVMNEVYKLLKDLEEDAKQRVIDWVLRKFSLQELPQNDLKKIEESEYMGKLNDKAITSFDSVADLFSVVDVKREPEKVLLIASYLQKRKGQDLTGREINKELIHLGHGIGNITNAITSLMKKKPQLMIQTRKEGKTKQAQKKYKVTAEGLNAAQRIITQSIGERNEA